MKTSEIWKAKAEDLKQEILTTEVCKDGRLMQLYNKMRNCEVAMNKCLDYEGREK